MARRQVELNALANRLYGLDPTAFRFLMNTLFDTPRHRDTHFEYRDASPSVATMESRASRWWVPRSISLVRLM